MRLAWLSKVLLIYLLNEKRRKNVHVYIRTEVTTSYTKNVYYLEASHGKAQINIGNYFIGYRR